MSRTYYPVGHPKHVVRHGRHGQKRGRRGKPLTKFKRAHFIAWDTEGATLNGEHRTICVCNSEGFHLSREQGLSTAEMLLAVTGELQRNPKAIHVGFAFGYDVNMLLADCTQSFIETLCKNTHAKLWHERERYWVEFIPRKYVSLYRWLGSSFNDRERVGGRIWDVFGFFQKSFVEALKEWLPDTSPDIIDRISSMKIKRSEFNPSELKDIIGYCVEECRMLVLLMKKLHEGLLGANLHIRRWDGAGAIAATLLASKGMEPHYPRESDSSTVDTPARYAYFGGRIECVRFGHTTSTPIYRYDLVSAYPSALFMVPSLGRGKWKHSYGQGFGRFSIHHIKWDLRSQSESALYPFPWRDRDGYVYFPAKGEGWYWRPEIDAACAAFDKCAIHGGIDFIETLWWDGEIDVRPFAWIPETFAERKRLKEIGHPAQFALKLGLNSCYGKLAQHVTYRQSKIQKPKWHCLPWAGWTTSTTRGLIYRAAIEAGWQNVIMLATDGIFSLSPIGYCDASEGRNLGQWERSVYQGCTVVQSGVYWVDKESVPRAQSPSYTRGFERRNVNRWDIIRGWLDGDRSINTVCRRFIGMQQAVRGRWDLWRHWTDETDGIRKLDLYPSGSQKRETVMDSVVALPNPSLGLISTRAVTPPDILMGINTMSTPIEFAWTAMEDPSRELHNERLINESDEAEL